MTVEYHSVIRRYSWMILLRSCIINLICYSLVSVRSISSFSIQFQFNENYSPFERKLVTRSFCISLFSQTAKHLFFASNSDVMSSQLSLNRLRQEAQAANSRLERAELSVPESVLKNPVMKLVMIGFVANEVLFEGKIEWSQFRDIDAVSSSPAHSFLHELDMRYCQVREILKVVNMEDMPITH